MKRSPISACTPAQRAAVRSRVCVVCGFSPVDPAHLIPRGLAADLGDARAVVPLCRSHHRAYDEQGLSLLEHLEPHDRPALAFAVERFGLLNTLFRVTNHRWVPEGGWNSL